MPEVAAGETPGKPAAFEKGLFYDKSALRQIASGFVQHNYESPNGKWKLAGGLLVNGSSDFGAAVFGGAAATY
ncbi:MAG: hypothetical protein K2L79_05595, partial [Bacteroidales bacterium]|nr:hypothetical protein [Bacteroidales bacterium]